MQPPDLVVFDFDGTLADSMPWFLDTINGAAARFGFRPLDGARVDEYRGMGARQLMAELGVRWWQIPRVTAYMRASMRERLPEVSLFAGVDGMLATLRAASVKLALLTSNDRHNVETLLGPRLLAHFDTVATGAPIFGKRRRLVQVLRHCAVAPSRALCIGDETRDADMADSLGVPFAGVAWGYATPAALQPRSAVPLFRTMPDIVRRVLGPDAAMAVGRLR